MHFPDIAELQIFRKRRGQCIFFDNFSLVITGLSRGVTPDHGLLFINLRYWSVQAHLIYFLQ
jgi:hypothetical protein